MSRSRRSDRGAVLVLTLVLTVVLALVVLALVSYVTVGLRTSDTASERSETNADSSNAMQWAIEQFAKKQLVPDSDCADAPTYATIVVPTALVSNGSTTTLQCAQTEPITGDPVVHLIATSVADQTRVVEATVEVPLYVYGARVADWRVDIPIDVPPYVTTTTSPAATTTTTTTTPNVAPTAGDMSVAVNPGSTTSFTLNATDPDGTIVSSSVSGEPASWTVNTSGVNVDVTVDGSLGPVTLTYTVTDDDGATSVAANLTVDVVSTPTTTTTTTSTTTTTTVPPMPDCEFEITQDQGNGQKGEGNLSVSNTGSSFTGWTVEISQSNPSDLWRFYNWASGVTVVGSTSPTIEVTGTDTIGATVNYSVKLDQADKDAISAGDTLNCAVLSIGP